MAVRLLASALTPERPAKCSICIYASFHLLPSAPGDRQLSAPGDRQKTFRFLCICLSKGSASHPRVSIESTLAFFPK